MFILFFLIFSGALFARTIALVTDFPPEPLKKETPKEELPIFYRIQQALAKNGDSFFVSDLSDYCVPKKRGWWPAKAKKTDAIETFVFWNIPSFAKKLHLGALPKEKMVLFIWEPPTVLAHLHKVKTHDPFGKIYTFDDSMVDGVRYFKYFYPSMRPLQKTLVPFEKRELCTQIVSNKQSKHPRELYSERKRVIRFFETKGPKHFTFYGYGWDAREYKNYGGTVEDKIEKLQKYRFSICYENIEGIPGYITEKIFDCFTAGAIPIYLGAPNITDHIPKNCFIDRRDFATHDELFTFLLNFSKNDYDTYLDNIKKFLESEKAFKFTPDFFIQTFQESFQERL